jgi:hypothetical protein
MERLRIFREARPYIPSARRFVIWPHVLLAAPGHQAATSRLPFVLLLLSVLMPRSAFNHAFAVQSAVASISRCFYQLFRFCPFKWGSSAFIDCHITPLS